MQPTVLCFITKYYQNTINAQLFELFCQQTNTG